MDLGRFQRWKLWIYRIIVARGNGCGGEGAAPTFTAESYKITHTSDILWSGVFMSIPIRMDLQKHSVIAHEETYPLHALDNNPNWVNWVMRFNDALDAQKLNSSLSRLLEIGDWRKLGGRIRRKVRNEQASRPLRA